MLELNMAYLEQIEAQLKSGELADDFKYAPEGRRFAILEFLEKLMDVAEQADALATELIFKGSQLGLLAGVSSAKTQK